MKLPKLIETDFKTPYKTKGRIRQKAAQDVDEIIVIYLRPCPLLGRIFIDQFFDSDDKARVRIGTIGKTQLKPMKLSDTMDD